jgi:hypothetical protein
MSMSSFVMLSYCCGLSLEIGKLGFKRHEVGRTMVCVATDVMPVSRYSFIEGMLPVLPHVDSVNHEANVSYHLIQNKKDIICQFINRYEI